jgi:hypothetical protein
MPRAAGDAGGLVALVPEGGRFEGLVATRGDSRLEGAVEGEVVVAGRVEVGEKAQVRARIEADEIVIEGAVEGDVTSRRFVERPCSRATSTPRASPRRTAAASMAG